jgi:hypothetical protein
MKTLLLMLLLSALPLSAVAQITAFPEAPKVDAKYVFYLHGSGTEKYGVMKSDEDYRNIIKTLQDRGFTVISEVRSSDTKPNEYGRKVADQVKTLITRGVPPQNIAVIGYSKGGLITLWAAGAGNHSQVNYVVLAGCFKKGNEFYARYAANLAPTMKGRMLSMYDAADREFGTCQDFFTAAGDKVTGKEITFETGYGHDLFKKPLDQWMNPLTDWVNGK